MANSFPSQNGKGSARRRENLAKVRENWDSIDWSKGRPAAKRLREQFGESTGRVLVEDYADSGKKAEWVIPTTKELLGEVAKELAKPAPSKISEASFFLHYDPHLTPEENDINEQMQEDDLRPY